MDEGRPVLDLRVTSESGVSIVRPQGEIDMNNSPSLRDQLIPLAGSKPNKVIFDLSGVTHLDSSGVGTLVEFKRRLDECGGGQIVLAGLQPPRARRVRDHETGPVFYDCCGYGQGRGRHGEETGWRKFLRLHMNTLVACDFFTKELATPLGVRAAWFLAFIHVETRKVFLSPPTLSPHERWVEQQARNVTTTRVSSASAHRCLHPM
jgi:anti-anti-sigma factor